MTGESLEGGMREVVKQCPSTVKLGEERMEVHCEYGEGHEGSHGEFGGSVDEHSGKNVSVTIEWVEEFEP
jgi:hypothetical protein